MSSNVVRQHSDPGEPTSHPLDISELNTADNNTYAIRNSNQIIDSNSICMVEGRWCASSGSKGGSNLLSGQERMLQLRRTCSCGMPARAHIKAFNQEILKLGVDLLA
jgi:hypothetical protein